MDRDMGPANMPNPRVIQRYLSKKGLQFRHGVAFQDLADRQILPAAEQVCDCMLIVGTRKANNVVKVYPILLTWLSLYKVPLPKSGPTGLTPWWYPRKCRSLCQKPAAHKALAPSSKHGCCCPKRRSVLPARLAFFPASV